MKDGNRFDASGLWSNVEIKSQVSSEHLASIFSVREIEKRGDNVQDRLYDAESKAEMAELEKEQLEYMLFQLKEQKVYDGLTLSKISPDYEKIHVFSEGIQRVSQLSTSRNKTSLDGIIQFRKNLNEMRKKHQSSIQEKRQQLLMELKENQELKKEYVERQMEVQRLSQRLLNLKKENQKMDFDKFEQKKEQIKEREYKFISDFVFIQKVVDFSRTISQVKAKGAQNEKNTSNSRRISLNLQKVQKQTGAIQVIEDLKLYIEQREDSLKELSVRNQSPLNKILEFNETKTPQSKSQARHLEVNQQIVGLTPHKKLITNDSQRMSSPIRRRTTQSLEIIFNINEDVIKCQYELLVSQEQKLIDAYSSQNSEGITKMNNQDLQFKALGLDIILKTYENSLFRLDSKNKLYNDLFSQKQQSSQFLENLSIQLSQMKGLEKILAQKKGKELIVLEMNDEMTENSQVCYKMKLVIEKGEMRYNEEITQTFDQFERFYKEVSNINKAQVQQDHYTPKSSQKNMPHLNLKEIVNRSNSKKTSPNDKQKAMTPQHSNSPQKFSFVNTAAAAQQHQSSNLLNNASGFKLKNKNSTNQGSKLKSILTNKSKRNSLAISFGDFDSQGASENQGKSKFAQKLRRILNYSLLFNQIKKIIDIMERGKLQIAEQVRELRIKQSDGEFFGDQKQFDQDELETFNKVKQHKEFMKDYQRFYNTVSKQQMDKRMRQIKTQMNQLDDSRNKGTENSLVNQAFASNSTGLEKDIVKDEEIKYLSEARISKKQEIIYAQNHKSRLKESSSHKQILSNTQFKIKEFELYSKSLLSLEKDEQFKNGYTDMYEALQNPEYLKFYKTKIEKNIERQRVLSKNIGVDKLINIGEHIDMDNAPKIFSNMHIQQKGKTQFMRDLEKLTQKQIAIEYREKKEQYITGFELKIQKCKDP
eukprot:403349191